MEEILMGFVSKALNLEGEQLVGLLYKPDSEGKPTKDLNENALQQLLDTHAKHIEAVKGKGVDEKTIFDRGHAAGKKDSLEKFERQIKEAFGIQADVQGIDLVKVAASTFLKSETSADKIKVHPEYLAAEAAWQSQLTQKVGEWESKYQQLEQTVTKEKTFAQYMPKIDTAFAKLNPVLPSNPEAATYQRNQFFNDFKAYDFLTEGGKDYVIKDGKRLENAQGHPLTLDEVVRINAAMRFDFAVQSDRGAAGNKNGDAPGASGQGSSDSQKFANREAFLAAYQAEGDGIKRAEIVKAWHAQNPKD